MGVVSIIRQFTGEQVGPTMRRVNACPIAVLCDAPYDEAKALSDELIAAGAKVELVERGAVTSTHMAISHEANKPVLNFENIKHDALEGLLPFVCAVCISTDQQEAIQQEGDETRSLRDFTNQSATIQLVLKTLDWFVHSVSIRMTRGNPCFLICLNEENTPIFLNPDGGSGISPKIKMALSQMMSAEDCSVVLDVYNRFFVVFWTEGSDHWDYNFLKLSGTFGQDKYGNGAGLAIVGLHPKYKAPVTQSYCDGDYDTGIQILEGDIESYGGLKTLEQYWNLSSALLERSHYEL